MKPTLIALLATLTLHSQQPERLILVVGPTHSQSRRTEVEEVLSEDEIRELIEPTIQAAKCKIIKQYDATQSGIIDVLNVSPKAMKDGDSVRGLKIMVALSRAEYSQKTETDPEILSQFLWVLKKKGIVLREVNLKRQTLGMVAMVLSKRLGRTVLPVDPPEGKDYEFPPVFLGPGGYVGPACSDDQAEYEDPSIKFRPSPTYPEEAKKNGVAGLVVVQIVISPEGVPEQANVVAGPALLRQYAREFALQCRFEPGRCGGKAIWSQFYLKLPFRLTKD